MRKFIFIPVCILVFFLIEFFLFNLVGRGLMPNLTLIAIIYFNLAFGIRYSIFAAVLAGLLKDSFGIGIFGLNMFSYVLCAYMTTILKKYLHYVASWRSRLLLVFFINLILIMVQFSLQSVFGNINAFEAFRFVFIPEILLTLLVTSFVFALLKKCALRLFA